LAYFRKRVLADADRDRIQSLIKKLSDDSFDVREQATNDLLAAGAMAAPLLRQAAKSSDAEVVERAQNCLKHLQADRTDLDVVTAARLLAFCKPAGAAEVLLSFLPFAEDDASIEATLSVLPIVARRDGKAEPAVLRALEAGIPLQRAAAAEALCRSRADELP